MHMMEFQLLPIFLHCIKTRSKHGTDKNQQSPVHITNQHNQLYIQYIPVPGSLSTGTYSKPGSDKGCHSSGQLGSQYLNIVQNTNIHNQSDADAYFIYASCVMFD